DARYDSDGDPTHRQQFLFSAKEMDEETGLYYFGARYLDPVRARWVSTDPAFTDSPELALTRLREMNVYGYAALSPVVLGDPDGRCAALGGMRVSCAAPGIEAMSAGAAEAYGGWRSGNIFDMTSGSAMAAVGALSAAAGTVLDFTVGASWNSGVDYGSGVDTLVQTGGKDSGTLLRGSAALFTLAASAKLPGPASAEGGATQGAGQGFTSFEAFKRSMGPAGEGQAWHHIVEQTPGNVARFGAEAIHNTANLVRLPHGAGSIHAKVSGYYSSKQAFTGGLRVRDWLGGQPFEAQRDFGMQVVKMFGGAP
ncbi:MAG: RHS repeat-associated core domain-containing protein, partial [Anaeromyxobacteraceae bacterium]